MSKILISLSLAKPKNGVYASVMPDARSCAKLKKLLEHVDFIDPVSDGSMHVTILYSYNDNQVTERPEGAAGYSAVVSEFTTWVGHNGKPYLVALLESVGLRRANRAWTDLDYTESFPQYRPHVTIKKDFVHPRPLEVVTRLNNLLKMNPIRMTLGPQVVKELDG